MIIENRNHDGEETSRNVVDLDKMEGARLAPRHLSKLDFGKRLHKLQLAKGWNQSQLAQAAGLTRDNISTYINGKSFPTPTSLKKLADVFGMSIEELLPNRAQKNIENGPASLEIRSSATSPTKAWLKVNRLVRMSTAVKIAELIENDDTTSDDDD